MILTDPAEADSHCWVTFGTRDCDLHDHMVVSTYIKATRLSHPYMDTHTYVLQYVHLNCFTAAGAAVRHIETKYNNNNTVPEPPPA